VGAPHQMRPRTRIPPSFASPSLLSRRHASSSSGKEPVYHRKVVALPFAVSPDSAKETFRSYAKSNLDELGLRGMLQSIWKSVFNSIEENGKMLERLYEKRLYLEKRGPSGAEDVLWQMAGMRPVYVPTWWGRTIVMLKYVREGRKDVKETGLKILNAAIPGHGYRPLSRLLLSEPWSSSRTQPELFTPSMLHTPWGDTVTALSYSVSPLRAIEMLRKLPRWALASSQHGITILPNIAMTETFIVPLLRPVYIAEFVLKLRSQSATLILPAWEAASSDIPRESYVYGPLDKDDHPKGATYTSKFNAEYSNGVGTIQRAQTKSPDDRARWEDEQKIIQVLKERRQRVDWSSIGGVDKRMWEERAIVEPGTYSWAGPEKVNDVEKWW